MKALISAVLIILFALSVYYSPKIVSWNKIQNLQDRVKTVLNDPDSAMFKEVYVMYNEEGCGYVNSKNALGGYVGYKKFVTWDGDVLLKVPLALTSKEKEYNQWVEAFWQTCKGDEEYSKKESK